VSWWSVEDVDGNVLASVALDPKNNVLISAKEDVTVKAKTYSWTVRSGPVKALLTRRQISLRDVVTSGPTAPTHRLLNRRPGPRERLG